jgi:hypothetical protein
MRVLLSLVFLSFAAGAPFQTHSHSATTLTAEAALRFRGGGSVRSPIDPELAGKLITGMILTQGTASFLAPKQLARAYGRETTPLSEICTASWGAYGTYVRSTSVQSVLVFIGFIGSN